MGERRRKERKEGRVWKEGETGKIRKIETKQGQKEGASESEGNREEGENGERGNQV